MLSVFRTGNRLLRRLYIGCFVPNGIGVCHLGAIVAICVFGYISFGQCDPCVYPDIFGSKETGCVWFWNDTRISGWDRRGRDTSESGRCFSDSRDRRPYNTRWNESNLSFLTRIHCSSKKISKTSHHVKLITPDVRPLVRTTNKQTMSLPFNNESGHCLKNSRT